MTKNRGRRHADQDATWALGEAGPAIELTGRNPLAAKAQGAEPRLPTPSESSLAARSVNQCQADGSLSKQGQDDDGRGYGPGQFSFLLDRGRTIAHEHDHQIGFFFIASF